MNPRRSKYVITLALLFLRPSLGTAQDTPTKVEGGYREVLVSAGYMTAIGAGIGAAMLAFKDEPHKNLRFITIGAASGFFVGTAFGAYTALSPSFSMNSEEPKDSPVLYKYKPNPLENHTSLPMPHDINLQPVFDLDSGRLTAMNIHLKLADF